MKKTRMSSVAVFSTLAFLLSAQSAWTAGLLRLESEGFLRTSENRDTSNYMLTFGPQFEDQGKVLAGKVDIKAISYLKNPDALTIESKNAYMATSPELLGMNQFTIGRREYDWSTMDDVWKFGMWTPRFTWDPLKPEQIGLTGAFYTHESSVWRVLVYSSPVSIPERSYPVRNSEGKVYSDSPYSIPLPEKVVMLKNQVDINYNIQDPQYSEILSRPAGAVQLRYGRRKINTVDGRWIRLRLHADSPDRSCGRCIFEHANHSATHGSQYLSAFSNASHRY